MKNYLSIIFLLAVAWMIGCSKKGEECPSIVAISDTYEKNFSQIKTGNDTVKDLATIKQATDSVQQSVKQLTNLQLTDEKLTALKASNSNLFKQADKILGKMTQTLVAMAEAEQQKVKTTQLFDEAKAALEAACEKKERRRKSNRKKRRECKEIDTQLKGLPTDEANADKVNAAVDGLKKLTVSFPTVKTAIDNIAGSLKERIETTKAYSDLQKKSDELKTQLEQQKKQNTTLAAELKTYCATD